MFALCSPTYGQHIHLSSSFAVCAALVIATRIFLSLKLQNTLRGTLAAIWSNKSSVAFTLKPFTGESSLTLAVVGTRVASAGILK